MYTMRCLFFATIYLDSSPYTASTKTTFNTQIFGLHKFICALEYTDDRITMLLIWYDVIELDM